jgi:hypothetical protein
MPASNKAVIQKTVRSRERRSASTLNYRESQAEGRPSKCHLIYPVDRVLSAKSHPGAATNLKLRYYQCGIL